LPEAAVLASLGCGNPTALIELKPGETVLDLGSGGGIDVLLSARRVGPTGKAYGLDMTPDMISLARRNAREAGVDNVEFIRGEIESIPLAPASVDVVISNCVINLSHDKAKVLREAYRVLRPGGRFAVSDIVVQEELPPQVRADLALWTNCIAGALSERAFADLLRQAGFTAIAIEPVRRHRLGDLGEDCCGPAPAGCGAAGSGEYDDIEIISAFVRATKPLEDGK
jgi:ubiquinone/menaquinone biosynthesis C-methylase UbiE